MKKIVIGSLLFCATLMASEPPIKPGSDARLEQSKPLSFEQKFNELKKDGWRIRNKPDHRDDLPITAQIKSGGSVSFAKPTVMRYSWDVVLRTIDHDNKSEIVLMYNKPSPASAAFRLKSGRLSSIDIMDRPIRYATAGSESGSILIEQNMVKNVSRVLVVIQERIEIVTDGQVVHTGYLNNIRVVEFEK